MVCSRHTIREKYLSPFLPLYFSPLECFWGLCLGMDILQDMLDMPSSFLAFITSGKPVWTEAQRHWQGGMGVHRFELWVSRCLWWWLLPPGIDLILCSFNSTSQRLPASLVLEWEQRPNGTANFQNCYSVWGTRFTALHEIVKVGDPA